MWDAQQTNYAVASAATVKTVYDPCPPGFCVPTSGLYDYIKNQTYPGWNSGVTYSGVFFPAMNQRGTDGTLQGFGSNCCWSATPNGYYVRCFTFDAEHWGLASCIRSLGNPVRAVAE